MTGKSFKGIRVKKIDVFVLESKRNIKILDDKAKMFRNSYTHIM